MKLRSRVTAGKIQIDMTPMIDVVFQLLIFFMCTLKMIEPEGDFDISMPLGAPKADSVTDAELPPFKVRMQADPRWRTGCAQLQRGKSWRRRRSHFLAQFASLPQYHGLAGHRQRSTGKTGSRDRSGLQSELSLHHQCDRRMLPDVLDRTEFTFRICNASNLLRSASRNPCKGHDFSSRVVCRHVASSTASRSPGRALFHRPDAHQFCQRCCGSTRVLFPFGEFTLGRHRQGRDCWQYCLSGSGGAVQRSACFRERRIA